MSCEIGTDIERAATLIHQGGLVAIPTETVYGLAANALDPVAVTRIFEAKERPFFDPLIVHVADVSWLSRIVTEFPLQARQLAERFWPGPLTLVLPKTSVVPDLVTSGLDQVGVRIPHHPMALALLNACLVPLAAPSANLFGRISPTTAAHVAEQLSDRIDYILDGGPCTVGVESTVVRLLPGPSLLRPGGIAFEDLTAVVGPVTVLASTDQPSDLPQSAPGMLPQHYAPRTRLIVESGQGRANHGRWGRLNFREAKQGFPIADQEVLSPAGDLKEAAMNFFAALRRLDALGLDGIIAESFPETGLGRALNDRLRRAAS